MHFCDESDSHFQARKKRQPPEEVPIQPCGLYYNDVTNSTICPHREIAQPLIYTGQS